MPSSTLDQGFAGLRERVYQGAAAGLDNGAALMSDGLHPNAAGHQAMAQAYRAALGL